MTTELHVLEAVFQGGNFALLCFIVIVGMPYAWREHTRMVREMQDRFDARNDRLGRAFEKMAEALRPAKSPPRRDRSDPDAGGQ
jgi:hypothetical protein